jgi:hypothetical protein
MKRRELANIVFKAMGLYWFVNAILLIIQVVLMPFTNFGNFPGNIWKIELITRILMGVLYALLSYLLIFRTASMHTLLKLNEDKDEIITSPDTKSDYERLAIIILGIYFFVPALSAVIPQVYTLLFLRRGLPMADMFQESYFDKSWITLFENSIQLIIGAFLMIGRSRLLRLWQRLRPLSPSNEEESEAK